MSEPLEVEGRDGAGAAAPAVLVAALAAALAVAVLVARVAGGDGRTTRAAAPTALPMVAPEGALDLASVPVPIAAAYRFAAAHREQYRQLRCRCGCEAAFGHRSLEDCFVRADGGWEAHGAGCAVCLGEAATASARLAAGAAPSDIAAELDARWGPPTGA